MRLEYGYKLSDSFKNWLLGRLAALILFGFQMGYILFAGYVDEFLEEPIEYIILPSISLSLIIFCKHTDWHITGEKMFIGGWVYLLYLSWSLFIEETVIYN